MSSVIARAAPGLRIGRFCLRSELGRGAQATVWLAHDERLDREVAIKLLDPAADSLTKSQWLHEARAVSRLAHPHIVPLFEADELDGRPYLVFELVRGRTLSEALRSQGKMAPREAVSLLLGVLDALQLAHGQGIVHRDLKPSNILVDGQGRARVMDFGIAARLADSSDGRIAGTPGYMSPEAARGESPAPAMDVFAAGMTLAEMLSGQRLLREADPMRALQRVQQEDMALPAALALDDNLRSIVQRAMARDAAMRFASAQAMHDALSQWLAPGDDGSAAAVGDGGNGGGSGGGGNGGSGNGTLDFLLRRMRNKTDFPALSQSVMSIQRIAASDNESLNALSAEILKDVALSNKLLRLVNTAHYRGGGGGNISTVSRAVALIGFAGIRNMALSLMLIEHMKDKTHALRLREEFLRALTAGQLASELAGDSREREEAFLGAMLYNLGRLLTEYYLPEEANDIRAQLGGVTRGQAPNPRAAAPNLEAVASRVLGIGFEQLGLGVARSWGLPDSLQRCMAIGKDQPPRRAVPAGGDRLRWLTACANDAADAVLRWEPEPLAACVQAAVARFGPALSLAPAELQRAIQTAHERVAEMAPALGLGGIPTGSVTGPVDLALTVDEQPGTVLLTQTIDMVLDSPVPDRVAAVLAAGIEDITNTLAADKFNLNSVLRMVLEAMLRGLELQRVVLCLRDVKAGALVGRIGMGDRADAVSAAFRISTKPPAGQTPDLLSAVCARGADILIADARADAMARRLPPWYVQHVNAPTFLLLPMSMKGSVIGLIYGDKAKAGSLAPTERELALLRTLRNQALMAFRHAG